jgi:uncharacterized protein (TIGR02996 family)
VSEREAFLKALADDEDDTTTRLVYADWLDERGEYEEADRQRKWPAAKAWLVKFCREYNPSNEDGYSCMSHKELMRRTREAAEQGDFGMDCEACEDLCDGLRANRGEFWRNWSIVTGIAVAPDAAQKSWFACSC